MTPTVHGNPLIGPTAVDIKEKEGTNTTADGISQVLETSGYSVKDIPQNQVITGFAGLRAHLESDDFRIEESSEMFFDAAGIESPGLSASPAIGLMMSEMVSKRLGLRKKDNFNPIRKKIVEIKKLSFEERKRMIQENPAYGEIICRCEEISEGEIIDAVRKNPGAKTLDGVKRRTRAGMGRCQSGFCSPRVMEILVREMGIDMQDVKKNSRGSELVFSKTRGGGC